MKAKKEEQRLKKMEKREEMERGKKEKREETELFHRQLAAGKEMQRKAWEHRMGLPKTGVWL